MSEELKPCPFCGTPNPRQFFHHREQDTPSFGVQCESSECSICGPERGYDLPLGYFSQNGGTTYVEVDPKFKGEPDVIPLYTRPAPRDVDAPIVLPEKPEPKYSADDLTDIFTAEQMDAHATAAVQKDRADWKETK